MTDRRLTINPEPLKVVTVRAGEPSPPPKPPALVLAIKRADTYRNGTRMRRVSVHRDDCPRTPSDGRAGWTVTAASQERISRALDEADRADVPVAVSCPTCRGWTAIP